MARRTGKTHRMIEQAFAEAREGRAVYMLAANRQHADHLRARVEEYAASIGAPNHGIKIETPGSVSRLFDWQTGQLLGAHPNCRVMADHFTIELHLCWALAELHRYDHPKGE